MEAVLSFFVNTNEANKKIKEFKKNVENVKNSLLTKMGAFGTALFGLSAIKTVYEDTKKLSNLSDKFNLPIEEVSKFSNVLSMFGGNTDDTINSLSNLEQAITEIRTTGGGALKQVANQIGLGLFDKQGKLKTSIDLLEDLRKKFKTLNEDAKLKISQELGISDPATLQLLKSSDEEYGKMLEKSKNMLLINDHTKEVVLNTHRTLREIRQSLFSIGAILLEGIEPVLKSIVFLFNKFNSLGETTKKVIVSIITGFVLFSPLLKIFSFLNGSIVSLISNIFSLGSILLKVFIANPIVASIVAIVSIITILYKKCETFRNIVNSTFKGISKSISIVWEKFKKLGDLWDKISFKRKKAEVEINEKYNKEIKKAKDFGIEDYDNELSSIIPSKNMINQSYINNNKTSNSNKNNTFNYNITINGNDNIRETENMLNRVIRQNSSGVY